MSSQDVSLKIAVLSMHTCPLAPLGGWETGGMNVYVRELGRALAARGASIDIFTRRQAADVADVVEYAPGARVIHIDAGPHRHVDKYDILDYLPDFACGIQRFRALTGASYDLIHSHYWLSGRLGLLFADRWGVPMVSTFHTLAQLKNRVAETAAEREQAVRFEIERRTMAGSDRIVALTQVDRQQMLRHYGGQAPIVVIPGGVDLERFKPLPRTSARRTLGLPSGRKVLLFVGRIQRLKGLEVLLRAFALLADLDAELLIVGGRPGTTYESREITRLQHLAAKLGVAERTRFVGAVPHEELPTYYSAADVSVMPSSYESFGLVAVESLACGTPVVATRVGGLTSIVRDGETGLLVPWRDAELFAERLRRVLSDSELHGRLATNARESVLGYGWDRIADEHLALYGEVRAQRRATDAVAVRG
ncbi:MAG: glycosyltransferase [Chloroflexi bacterium]|nr:glycosyltransferase [Chloroflexota bacterium]MBV9897803.1 glycosyltransferase [Chloroflexota bacterium]